MRPLRTWIGPALLALLSACGVSSALSLLDVAHNPWLVALLACAVVASGTLLLTGLESGGPPAWTAPRSDATSTPGEDTRTTMYRHVIEVHFSSHDHDDTVVWQIADLAARRLRQVHGIRFADDPGRATELLGTRLAGWVSLGRRERYQPDHRHPRHTLDELTDAVSRIERL